MVSNLLEYSHNHYESHYGGIKESNVDSKHLCRPQANCCFDIQQSLKMQQPLSAQHAQLPPAVQQPSAVQKPSIVQKPSAQPSVVTHPPVPM